MKVIENGTGKLLRQFIGKDMMPLSTVTKSRFTALINTLDKRYSMPFHTYFSKVAITELPLYIKNVSRELQQS